MLRFLRSRPFLAAAFFVALAGALAGCDSASSGPPPSPPPPEVTVVEAAPRSVELPYEYPGRLEGSREVQVRARVSGILLRRAYEEGRPVEQGQTLFLIDPAPYQAEVEAAEAQLAEEKAKLAQAERELARLEPLAAARAVSQREYDAALSEVELSRAAVGSAEARLRTARLNLSYTRVEAPISGLTSRARYSEGSLVGPGEDSLLTLISQVQPIWVRFAVSDEEKLALEHAVEAGVIDAPPPEQREVELIFADGSVYPEHGRVNFSDSVIDRETGSVALRAEIPNRDGTLVPGQFVRVRLLDIERPNTILVPQRAVQQGQQGKFVFIVNADGAAEVRPVKVGEWIGRDWILEHGLEGGEKVIVDGVVRVRPGAPVKIVEDNADGGANGGAEGNPEAEGGAAQP